MSPSARRCPVQVWFSSLTWSPSLGHRPHHRTRARHPGRILQILAQTRLHQLRRPRRADFDDASGTGGKTPLDFRAPLPARAQLLHAAARPRSDPTGDLHQLADARHTRRRDRRRAVLPAVLSAAVAAGRPVSRLRQPAVGTGHFLRHPAGGGGGGAVRGLAHRQQGTQERGAVGHGGAGLHRHFRVRPRVPVDRAGRRPARCGRRQTRTA